MTGAILAVQVALPLALLIWLARAPARDVAGFSLQAAGTGLFLLALAHVAQWALPVWWLPRVYGVLWMAAIAGWVMRWVVRRRPQPPSARRVALTALLSLILAAVGGGYGVQALSGRSLPPGEILDIANPLGPGRYLVGHGGSNKVVNGHMRTLDPGTERFLSWRGQSYAVDFFGLGPGGLRARGWHPVDPEAYAIFGAELRAPCAGTVVAAEGRLPDFNVPDQDSVNRLGNHVIVRCGEVEVVLAHMRCGSVEVVPGQRVAVGERLGEVGNSGASSEPHLHIHAQRPAADGAPPISGEPIGLRIEGRFLVRGDHLTGQDG